MLWLVELTAIANYYAMLCGIVNAFEVDPPPTATGCRLVLTVVPPAGRDADGLARCNRGYSRAG